MMPAGFKCSAVTFRKTCRSRLLEGTNRSYADVRRPVNLALACGEKLREPARAMKKNNKKKSWGDATLAIHAGEEKFHVSAPVGTSVARTANFTFGSAEEMKLWAEGKSSAYVYTRYGNPTLAVAEIKACSAGGEENLPSLQRRVRLLFHEHAVLRF